MPNAAIYARFSSAGQQEQSITGQLRDCRAFCERNEFTVVAEYTDEAISGRTDRRPGFQKMIQDAKGKSFDLIIVWKTDRFSRDSYDAIFYKRKLREYGVKVMSAMEPMVDGNESIIMERLLESMAEYYSLNLSANVKRGIRESVLQQNFTGGMVPLGYRVENKKLRIREEAAPVIVKIFEMYRDGKGKKEIVTWLAAHGVKTNYGKPVSVTTLEHVLSNRRYIGEVTVGDLSYHDESIRIIPDELFEAVQRKLRANYRRGGKKKAVVRYLLSGKCYCGHCGSAMVGESGQSRNGEIHNYYSCRSRKKKHSCAKKNEQKEALEKYVVQQTVTYFLDPSRLSKTADAIIEAYSRQYNTGELDSLEKEIRKLESEAVATVDLVVGAAGSPTLQKRYEAKLVEIDERKAALEDEYARMKVAVGVRMSHAEVMAALTALCTGDVEDPDFRERIIDGFVNSVYIWDDRITIFYNMHGSEQVSYQGTLAAMEDKPPDGPAAEKSAKQGLFPCSDAIGFRPPYKTASEHPEIIYAEGKFGCVFHRE